MSDALASAKALYAALHGSDSLARRATPPAFVQLPTRNITSWTPDQVNRIIEGAQYGSLERMGDLVADIYRDDRVRGVLSTRTLGMLGLPLTWDGETPDGWNRLALEAELNKLLRWGLLGGVGFARIKPSGALQTWHMRYFRQDPFTFQWYALTVGGEKPIFPGLGEWVMYAPYGEIEPWDEGLWTALAIPWLIKRFALHDRARASEVFGSAMIVGNAAEGSTEDQRAKWRDELRNLSRSSRIVLPDGYSLDLLEAQGQTWNIYKQSAEWADAAITVAIAGQLVTTEGQSGFSKGDIHQAIANSLIQFGAETFATCLAEQYVRPVWRIESRPKWDIAPPEQAKQRSEAVGALGTAISTTNAALASYELRLDVAALATENGVAIVPLPADEASGSIQIDLAPTDKARIITVNEGRRTMGFPDLLLPDGTRNPLGDKLVSDLQTLAPTPADTAQAGGNAPSPTTPSPLSLLAASDRIQWPGDTIRFSGIDVSSAPEEFRIFRFGRNDTSKGSFIVRPQACKAIMSTGRPLMIDLEHLSLLQESKNYNPDAMGWADYQVRTDGLWAVNVKWTDEGRERIEKKRQRFISPAVRLSRGIVTSLINVALTALPAMHDPAPLIAASQRKTLREHVLSVAKRYVNQTERKA